MSHTKYDIVILEERMNRLLDPPIFNSKWLTLIGEPFCFGRIKIDKKRAERWCYEWREKLNTDE